MSRTLRVSTFGWFLAFAVSCSSGKGHLDPDFGAPETDMEVPDALTGDETTREVDGLPGEAATGEEAGADAPGTDGPAIDAPPTEFPAGDAPSMEALETDAAGSDATPMDTAAGDAEVPVAPPTCTTAAGLPDPAGVVLWEGAPLGRFALALADMDHDGHLDALVSGKLGVQEIGRASCRERV